MARSLTRREDWPTDAVGVRRHWWRSTTSDARAVSWGSCVDAQVRDAVAGLCRRRLNGGRSPQPSEGQQSLQLRIQDWLGLLGLTLREQIIEEPSQADQAPAPAFLAEEEQQAIAACGEVQPPGGMSVNGRGSRSEKRGHGGHSAGPGLQAGRGQGPATILRCTASCGTTVSKPRAWLRSLTPPRTMKRPAQRYLLRTQEPLRRPANGGAASLEKESRKYAPRRLHKALMGLRLNPCPTCHERHQDPEPARGRPRA